MATLMQDECAELERYGAAKSTEALKMTVTCDQSGYIEVTVDESGKALSRSGHVSNVQQGKDFIDCEIAVERKSLEV